MASGPDFDRLWSHTFNHVSSAAFHTGRRCHRTTTPVTWVRGQVVIERYVIVVGRVID